MPRFQSHRSPNGYFVRVHIYRELLNDVESANKDREVSDKLMKEQGL